MTQRPVNAYLPDGTWAGMFIDADVAWSWLHQHGYQLDACEVSSRRPSRPS